MFGVPTTRRGKRRTHTPKAAGPSSEPNPPPGATRSSIGRFLRLRRRIRRRMSGEKAGKRTEGKQGLSEGLWTRGAYLLLPTLQEVTEDVTEREKVRRRLAKRYGYSLGEDPAQAPQHLPPLSPCRRTLSAVHREDQALVPSQQQVAGDDVNPGDGEEVSSSVLFR
ncbi:PREDICTED: uncharacterized protein LOC109487645 [Branchiostoma belcheri]|uniref:Uncharacterized protein LOC109487645 n=1 Tax=Branchiostoma belcheri TaxID=7741 RepID=A0A6P5ALZ8_BRABE|nr:PREDICTED: uncharacterized protein LOC109487645 [Branchiostoma belcheri]